MTHSYLENNKLQPDSSETAEAELYVLYNYLHSLPPSFSQEESGTANSVDRPISRGGGADMYPDSRTKGRGHRGAWIKRFCRRRGRGRGRRGVRGEGAMLKKSQMELRSDRRRL